MSRPTMPPAIRVILRTRSHRQRPRLATKQQAVRITREFEFPGEEAILRKEGDRLVIEPVPTKSLLALLAKLAPLPEDFPPILDVPPDAVEL